VGTASPICSQRISAIAAVALVPTSLDRGTRCEDLVVLHRYPTVHADIAAGLREHAQPPLLLLVTLGLA